MPVHVVCPECGATTTLEGSAPAAGTVSCRQCFTPISVPAGAANGPPAAAKPAAPAGAASKSAPPPLPPTPVPGPKPAGGFDVVEDDEDEELDDEGRPAVGRRRRDDDEEYEDDDDDRPRSRRGRDDDDEDDEDDDRRPARSRRGDDDDDEDERPRSRRGRDDDDDDEDERPRRAAARGRDDDDEDDDEDEAPRRPARARDDDDEDEDDEDDRRRSARARDDDDEDDEDERRAAARSRDDDDEEEDERPRRSAQARDEDDEDDEDESPRRAAARGRDEDEDEEDEDDERPRRAAARGRDDDDEEEDERPRRAAAGARDDDGDEDDEKPAGRSRAVVDDDGQIVARGARRDEDDDEEDDDGYAASRRRRDDDDEDDDYDRPRKKSNKGLLIAVGLIAFLMLGAGGAAAVYFLVLKDDDTTVANNTNNNTGGPDLLGGREGQQDSVIPNRKGSDTKGPDAKGTNTKGPEKKGPEPKKAAGPLALYPVAFDGDRKTVPLPGKVAESCAGGDGRFLFYHCPDEKKLVVFDVPEAKVVKELPTAGKDARFAAGATKLLLTDPAAKTIKRFDLTNLNQDKEAPLPFPGAVKDIALGSGSHGPALVLTDAPADAWPVYFLDVETLAAADVGWTAIPPADLPRDLRFRAAANGSRVIGQATGPNTKGAVLVTRAGKQLTATRIAPEQDLGYAALSGDGLHYFSRFGELPIGVTNPSKQPANPAAVTLPAVTGSFEVQVAPAAGSDDTAEMSVNRRINKGWIPKTVGGVPRPFKPGDPVPPDQLVHFVPDAKAAYVVSPGRDKVEVVKIDQLSGSGRIGPAITSSTPDTFTPGKTFTYSVRVVADGPFGIGVSTSGGANELTGVKIVNGAIEWTPAANETRAEVTFLAQAIAGPQRTSQVVHLYNTSVPAPKGVEPKKSPDSKSPAVVAGEPKLVMPAKTKVPITPAELADAHVEIPMPGTINDVCVGGGGRFLIFHVPAARKLVIFDVTAAKVVKELTVQEDEVFFAAGMDKLLVVYPIEKTVLRYNLSPFKFEKDATLEYQQKPKLAAMGSATAGPLVLGGLPGPGDASKMGLRFIDIETLKEVKIDRAEGDLKVTTGSPAYVRMSADGRCVGIRYSQLQPSGLQIAWLEGNTIKGTYLAESVGHVTPSADGRKIYTELGQFDLDAKPDGPRGPVLPANQGSGYIALTGKPGERRQLAVWGAAIDKPMGVFDDLPGFDGKKDPFLRENINLSLDKRLFWVPDARVLVLVPPTADKLHVYRVGEAKK
jgi:hypothetical protein